MKICDLHTGVIRLSRAAKDLREQWTTAGDYWRDQNHDNFEAQYLQPLAPQMTLLMAAVNRLQGVLEQAERDLTDEERGG